jgi:hypothetical protein
METEPLATPFARLAGGDCPSYAEMLIALEREFRAVDRATVDRRLDELALPLFGLPELAPREQARILGATVLGALPGDGAGDEPADWLLACAIDRGCASGALRAALGTELARRAGVDARPVRLQGRWLVAVDTAGAAPVGADVGSDTGGGACADCTGCMCAHELALVTLSGLADAWQSTGRAAYARRAAGLRLLLPVDEALRDALVADTRRFGG